MVFMCVKTFVGLVIQLQLVLVHFTRKPKGMLFQTLFLCLRQLITVAAEIKSHRVHTQENIAGMCYIDTCAEKHQYVRCSLTLMHVHSGFVFLHVDFIHTAYMHGSATCQYLGSLGSFEPKTVFAHLNSGPVYMVSTTRDNPSPE